MDHSKESEEKFDKATSILDEIAEATEHEREEHETAEFVMPENRHAIAPLKGPHHTPSE